MAETPYFLDFKLILNESVAEKKLKIYLKNKLDKGFKDINSKQDKIAGEEKNNSTKKSNIK